MDVIQLQFLKEAWYQKNQKKKNKKKTKSSLKTTPIIIPSKPVLRAGDTIQYYNPVGPASRETFITARIKQISSDGIQTVASYQPQADTQIIRSDPKLDNKWRYLDEFELVRGEVHGLETYSTALAKQLKQQRQKLRNEFPEYAQIILP